ncbi:MAG: VIT1/CCC1 transporter family protein [bacterium]
MLGGKLRSRIESSIREIVFGLEDSLVSTLGAITGIAAGTGSTYIVVLSGVVLIFAEAVSMAAGSYLSSKSAHEVYERRHKQDASRILQERVSDEESLHDTFKRKRFSEGEIESIICAFARERKLWLKEVERNEYRLAPAVGGSPIRSGAVMGIFYLVGGTFPLLPYFLFPAMSAIVPSIIITGILLFALGVWKAKIVDGFWLKSGLEMTIISLTAAVLGYFIGRAVSTLFGLSVF